MFTRGPSGRPSPNQEKTIDPVIPIDPAELERIIDDVSEAVAADVATEADVLRIPSRFYYLVAYRVFMRWIGSADDCRRAIRRVADSFRPDDAEAEQFDSAVRRALADVLAGRPARPIV